MILNGFAVVGLAFSGSNVILAVLFLSLSLCFHGTVSTGALAAIVDISPNFAGITLGVVSTVPVITGFVSPIIVGHLTFENQTVEAWRDIFLICAAMLFVCGIISIMFNDTSVQPWNKVSNDDKELQPLKPPGVVKEIIEVEKSEKVLI